MPGVVYKNINTSGAGFNFVDEQVGLRNVVQVGPEHKASAMDERTAMARLRCCGNALLPGNPSGQVPAACRADTRARSRHYCHWFFRHDPLLIIPPREFFDLLG